MHAHLLNFRPDWPNGMLPPRPRSASTDLPTPSTSFASLVFPANGSAPPQAKSEVAKSVIEWLLVGIALILLACLLLRRMLRWRAPPRDMHPDPSRNTAYAEALRATDVERLYSYGLSGIIPYPSPIYARPRAAEPHTRGVDVGRGGSGRRAGGDMELVLSMGEKDVLPVYDGRDRPPRYAEHASGGA